MQALGNIFGYSDPAPGPINNLPLATADENVLSLIIAKQPLNDIAAMSLVCRKFNRAANFENVWKQKALEYGLPDDYRNAKQSTKEQLRNFLKERYPQRRINPLSVRIKDDAIGFGMVGIALVATAASLNHLYINGINGEGLLGTSIFGVFGAACTRIVFRRIMGYDPFPLP